MLHRCFIAMLLLSSGQMAVGQAIPSASRAGQVHMSTGDVAYKATWDEMVLRDLNGQPEATISAISYVRPAGQAARRPVIFVYNGGPGAASAALNYGLFGPERRLVAGRKPYGDPIDTLKDGTTRPTRFVDNPDTLLDVADLVMIDPVGTGFSRELKPGGAQAYWNVPGDVASIERYIRDWLKRHDRVGAPIFLAGESYGGYRTGPLAMALSDLDVAGLILISPALDLSALLNDSWQVANVPTMAVAAAWHGRVPRRGRSLAAIYQEAAAFAEADYQHALFQGSSLPAAKRDRVAARMSGLIGLPAADIAAADLRVDTQAFLEKLLPGKIVGRLDDRATGDVPAGRDLSRDVSMQDPSLGMEDVVVQVSKPIGDHLRAMGVKTTGDYAVISFDVNLRWDWRGRTPAFDANLQLSAVPAFAGFMAAKPRARLLVAGGYHDLAVPVGATHYALMHSGIAPDRIAFHYYDAGHTLSDDDAARPLLAADLHRFVTAATR